MKCMPVRYVPDVEAAQCFYEVLGLGVSTTIRTPPGQKAGWAELDSNGAGVALHYATPHQPPAALELAFEAEEDLETVAERLQAAGYELASPIVDKEYGRCFTVRDPGELELTINEYDRELYT